MASPSSPTEFQPVCPTPFLLEQDFPTTGGFIPGRFCLPIPSFGGNLTCCLPCPATDWTYSDGFEERTEIANWFNVAALITTAFLLLTFLILPVKWTHRHYLSVCLAIGVGFMELSFLIPLAAKPEQCYNKITPNDMRSDLTCAFSGSFLLFGGWAAIMWVFYRALSLHLQICWQVVPGKRFFYSALIFGWGIPAAGLALLLSLTGVSYRFGNVCHINHKDGLQDFWGPLLAFSATAVVLQLITVGYCIHVYIRSLMDDKPSTETSSNLPSYQGSVRTVSARQAYRRVRKVIALQWRGVAIVFLIIADVIFFSVVFVSMDNGLQIDSKLLEKAEPWLFCLIRTEGNKDACLADAQDLVEKESVVLAVFFILGMSGFWILIFLGRWSMVLGWIDLVKRRLVHRHEFVSADARRLSNDPRTYEMLDSTTTPQPNLKTPEAVVRSPDPLRSTPYSPDSDSKADYFSRGSKVYLSPVSSFSTPRPPSSSRAREWDPTSTHARGGGFPGAELSKDFSV